MAKSSKSFGHIDLNDRVLEDLVWRMEETTREGGDLRVAVGAWVVANATKPVGDVARKALADRLGLYERLIPGGNGRTEFAAKETGHQDPAK
jgi:hypothetical protein